MPLQTLLVQSAPIRQPLPSTHAGAFVPPQSMSVSSSLFTPSAGTASLHLPSRQTADWQSGAPSQLPPAPHFVVRRLHGGPVFTSAPASSETGASSLAVGQPTTS